MTVLLHPPHGVRAFAIAANLGVSSIPPGDLEQPTCSGTIASLTPQSGKQACHPQLLDCLNLCQLRLARPPIPDQHPYTNQVSTHSQPPTPQLKKQPHLIFAGGSILGIYSSTAYPMPTSAMMAPAVYFHQLSPMMMQPTKM